MAAFRIPEEPFEIDKIMRAIGEQLGDGNSPLVAPQAPAADPLRQAIAELARRQAVEPPYRIHSHRPMLRPIVDSAKRLIHWGSRPYADAVRERQNEFNAATAEALRRMLERLAADNAALQRRLEESEAKSAEAARADGARAEAERAAAERRRLDAENALDARLAAIERRDRLDGFDRVVPAALRLAAMDKGRGTFADIQQRQKIYIDYFRAAPGQILDVGCGRGELLAMLRTEGIECWGADTDPLMIETTRASGVHAVQSDALAALQKTAPGSLGGVFGAQIAEHLYPGDLIAMIGLACSRLAPGGRIVLETINPASLAALSKSYFRDLDHKQPIHPEAMRQLLEGAGFVDVRIELLHPFRPDERLAPLPADDPATNGPAGEIVAANMAKLDALLYGMQDYYAVARRP